MSKTLDKETLKLAQERADEIAKEKGYEDAQELVEDVAAGLQSQDSFKQRAAGDAAGDFATKLTLQIHEQVILNSLGTDSVYGWIDKFTETSMKFGNRVEYNLTLLTTAGEYDRTKWIPDRTTGPMIETFQGQFLKNDKTLAALAYQYKKSFSIERAQWFPYFLSGKLETVISGILSEFKETFTLFIAQKLQNIITNLASGDAQVGYAAAGENGNALKLKKHESQAPDTFAAMVELMGLISKELTDDINNSTIANDSGSIKAVDLDDLIIFMPIDLIAKFRSGVMSRLPSSEQFNYDKIFNSSRIVPVGRKLQPIINQNTNEVVKVHTQGEYFLPNNKIVVMSRKAIRHTWVVKESGHQYYLENMIDQVVNHNWGFFTVLPFEKGFVFECANLLTDPA